MNCKTRMFGIALLILTLIVAVILGLLAGPTNPVTWLLIAVLVLLPFLHKKLSARPYVEWKDEYSVGIESIDLQHKTLLVLINQLQSAVEYSTGELFEQAALDSLVDYTKKHFSYEEGLMEKYGYPDFEAHKAQHDLMVKKVEQVLSDYQRNSDNAMQQAADFLKGWLINHINGTDKQYSEYLIGKGAK